MNFFLNNFLQLKIIKKNECSIFLRGVLWEQFETLMEQFLLSYFIYGNNIFLVKEEKLKRKKEKREKRAERKTKKIKEKTVTNGTT